MGEKLDSYSTIVSIQRKSIELDRGGRTELLVAKEKGGAPSSSMGGYGALTAGQAPKESQPLNRSVMDEYIRNGYIYEDIISLYPNTVNGVVQGFKVLEIRAGSIFELLNLKTNDVITKLGGSPMNSVESIIQFFQGLAQSKEFEVEVKQGEKSSTLRYKLD